MPERICCLNSDFFLSFPTIRRHIQFPETRLPWMESVVHSVFTAPSGGVWFETARSALILRTNVAFAAAKRAIWYAGELNKRIQWWLDLTTLGNFGYKIRLVITDSTSNNQAKQNKSLGEFWINETISMNIKSWSMGRQKKRPPLHSSW